ncbi:MAG: ABC transporter ATP-binding protein [Lachnospiraceae bacterium]|nr:ABC transporter ATP-binding protein [Lachnospiraceae bacterium]
MIELRDATKIYKGEAYETKAIDHMDLTIEDGAFVAIMGKSGSGKTTLLNIVGCMDSLTSGELFIDGEELGGLSEHKVGIVRRNKISFIFQNYALMQHYTVYENIELPLNARNYKYKDKKKAVNEIMEKLNIAHLASKFPRQISGGEQQRTAIARAMVSGCKYILADEPTGALDSMTSAELMKLFQMMHEMGKTILVVTHDNEVARYAQKTIIISDGRIETVKENKNFVEK